MTESGNSSGSEILQIGDVLAGGGAEADSSAGLHFTYDAEVGAIRVDITHSSGTHKQSIAVPGVDVTAGGALSDSQIIQILLAQGQSAKDT